MEPQRRTSSRNRKVNEKVVEVLLDEGTRQRAFHARLEALENDGVDFIEEDDGDDLFEIQDVGEEGFSFTPKAKKPKVGQRRTRQSKSLESDKKKGKKALKAFADYLHEANLESLPKDVPTYLTAAAKPSTSSCKRFFCSVCGYVAPYTCVRCGSRFCCIKCNTVHSETRCLKFVA